MTSSCSKCDVNLRQVFERCKELLKSHYPAKLARMLAPTKSSPNAIRRQTQGSRWTTTVGQGGTKASPQRYIGSSWPDSHHSHHVSHPSPAGPRTLRPRVLKPRSGHRTVQQPLRYRRRGQDPGQPEGAGQLRQVRH
uniref:Uncharacterized protein n=2 Tax=Graphocephala atropunctata TaxID=36148 RepID=A0A1B6L200_9HEMI